MFIDLDTLTTIEKTEGGYLLKAYLFKYPVFSQVYDTMRGAKIAEKNQLAKMDVDECKRAGKTETEKAVDIISSVIAYIIYSTKTNKDYNAHNLARDALKVARDILQYFPAVEFIPGEPNTKTGIKSIDLLPSVTCHARCLETCGKIEKGRKFNAGRCYAFRLMYRNANTCARYAINTALLIDRPETFWTGVNNLMRTSRFVRCFVAGDGNIPGFFDSLYTCLKNNPHCTVQGFTKCYENYNACIDKNGMLDNCKFLLSGWNELKPVNPHNLPISDVYDQELPDGWLSCGGNCLNCACVGLGCWKAGAGDVVGLKKH